MNDQTSAENQASAEATTEVGSLATDAGTEVATTEGGDAATDPAAPAAPTIQGKEFTFFFKTDVLRDADGKAIGKGRKHPDVKAILPVPTTLEEIVERAKAEPKIATLVLETLYDAIFLAGRAQINAWREDNTEGDFKANNFDLSKLTLEAIALMPPKARGAYAPSDDELKAFAEEYSDVMLNAVQYDAKKVATHVDLFKKGCMKIKTNKVALAKLKDVMAIFASRTENMEEQEAVYEWLTTRIDRWLKAEEKDYSEAI